MKKLHDYFSWELQVLYSAAKFMQSITKKMSSAATEPKVAEIMDTYYFQSLHQQKKIEEYIHFAANEKQEAISYAMSQLADEAHAYLTYEGSTTIRDIALLTVTHKMKHYEIALSETATRHAEMLQAQEAVELLNTVKKKIAEDPQDIPKFIRKFCQKKQSTRLNGEAEGFLYRLLQTQAAEEKVIESFSTALEAKAVTDPLRHALKTYRKKHVAIEQFIANAKKQMKGRKIGNEANSAMALFKESEEALHQTKEKSISDIVIISNLQKVMHVQMAAYEIETVLADYLDLVDIQDHINTILEHEASSSHFLASIADESMLQSVVVKHR